MSKYLVRGETLTAVADAIRNKTGKTGLITLNDFVTEIEQVDYREVIDTVPSITGSLTYNGSEQSPTILAYNPDQLMMTGISSATNAGTYEIAFSPKEGYKWADDTTTAKVVEWSIAKANGSLSLSATSSTVSGKNVTKTFTVTRAGDGKITAVSSSTSIATVSVSGTTVTVKSAGYGSATITVSVAEGTNHKAPSNKTYTFKVNYVYLYNKGDQCTNLTGGWTTSGCRANGWKAVFATINSGNIYLYATNNVGPGGIRTTNKVDLSNSTKLKLLYTTDSDVDVAKLVVLTNSNDDMVHSPAASKKLTKGTNVTISLDISSFTSNYIGVTSPAGVYIYQIWLE